MRPPDLIPSFLAFLLGFLTRPVIMGCLQSKPQPIKHPTSHTDIQQPLQQQPQLADPFVEQPLAADKVADVPKPKVEVTDRDRAFLKIKSLRDKVEYLALQSDAPLKEYGRRAVLAKREGNMVSARMFLMSRNRLRERVEMHMANVQRLNDMVDAMDDVRQNEKLFQALESGTKAINDTLSVMTPEKVQQVLDDSHEAKGSVAQLNALMGEEDAEMSDSDFETAMAQLEGEFGEEPDQRHGDRTALDDAQKAAVGEQSSLQKTLNIPDVPTELPAEPDLKSASENVKKPRIGATAT